MASSDHCNQDHCSALFLSKVGYLRQRSDALHARTEGEMQEKIVTDISAFLRVMTDTTNAFLFMVLCNMMFKMPRWMSDMQTIITVFLSVFSETLLSLVGREMLKQRYVQDAIHLSFMVIVLAFVFTSKALEAGDVRFVSYTTTLPIRILLNIALKNPNMSLICGGGCTLISWAVDGFSDTPFGTLALLREPMTACLSVGVARVSENTAWTETYHRLAVQLVQAETQARRSLLEYVCDVALELDSNLRCAEDCPSLSNILGNSSTWPKGQPITDLLRAEDAARLRQHMCSDSTTAAGVGSFCASIKDSYGIHTSVELFFTTFETLQVGKRYLVGLREFTDEFAQQGHRASQKVVDHQGAWPKAPSKPRRTSSDGHLTGKYSRGPSSTLKKPSLSCACLQATSEAAKIYSVEHTLRQWNIQLSRVACCALHAHIHECTSILKKLKRKPCEDKDAFALNMGDIQCKRCGIVAFDYDALEESRNEPGACHLCVSLDSKNLESSGALREQEASASPSRLQVTQQILPFGPAHRVCAEVEA